MDKLYLDLAIALFFLVAMVFVANLRELIKSRDKSSFKLLFGGLCVLAVMSLFSAIQNQLVLHDVVSSASSNYTEFIRMTMFILGLVLLTSGVTKWISRSVIGSETSFQTVGENLILKRTMFELLEPTSLVTFIPKSLNLLADTFGVNDCAVYAVSKTSNRARLVSQETTFSNTNKFDREVMFTPGWINGLTDSTLAYADQKVLSSSKSSAMNRYCFTISHSGQPKFLFMLLSNTNLAEKTHKIQMIKAISNSFKSRIANKRQSLKQQLDVWCSGVVETISEGLEDRSSVNEQVATVKKVLSNYLKVDFLSICSFDRTGQGRRITIGESGTVLNEIDINVLKDCGYVLQVINSNSMRQITDLEELDPDLLPEILQISGINNLLVMPLAGMSGIKGAVTFGTNSTGMYSAVEIALLTKTIGLIDGILNQIIVEDSITTIGKRERLLSEFVNDISTSDTESKIFQLAVDLISKVTFGNIARISTIDKEQKFISSKAISNHTKHTPRVPESGHILLSILPWHKIAAENGNTIIAKSGTAQNEMSDIETKQVFVSEITNTLIVPIKFGGRIYGLISLGADKLSHSRIFTSDKIQFVETVASIVAVVLDAATRSSDTLAEFASRAKAEIIESGKTKNLRNRIRSPLTSIIGSLEMIRSSDSIENPRSDKFLSMIDKSAHKLEEILRD